MSKFATAVKTLLADHAAFLAEKKDEAAALVEQKFKIDEQIKQARIDAMNVEITPLVRKLDAAIDGVIIDLHDEVIAAVRNDSRMYTRAMIVEDAVNAMPYCTINSVSAMKGGSEFVLMVSAGVVDCEKLKVEWNRANIESLVRVVQQVNVDVEALQILAELRRERQNLIDYRDRVNMVAPF